VLSGGHALLSASPASQDQAGETMGSRSAWTQARAVHADFAAVRTFLAPRFWKKPGRQSAASVHRRPVFAQCDGWPTRSPASPAAPSALLQAMQEQHVTVAGARHDLPNRSTCWRRRPARAGRHLSLPEAQLDRFLMEATSTIPTKRPSAKSCSTPRRRARTPAGDDLESARAQRLVRACPVASRCVAAILSWCARRAPARKPATSAS